MQSNAETVADYLDSLPVDRKDAMMNLRKAILKSLPKGFMETMSYGMIGYVVPHNLYPSGYHCNPKLPLPYINIASQKNFIAIYNMGLYANKELMDWFMREYPKHITGKLDMGKSCLRFKKPELIPNAFIGEMASKLSPKEWITIYENAFLKNKSVK